MIRSRRGHLAQRFREVVFFTELVLLGLAMRCVAKVAGFKRSVALLPRVDRVPTERPNDFQMARYRRLIDHAERFRPLLNCLSISTAAWWLLRRRGVDVQMRFGSAWVSEGFIAHAWLEHHGRPITNIAGLHERFTSFDRPIL